jgi:hypothetical protein
MRYLTQKEVDEVLKDIPPLFPNSMSDTIKQSYINNTLQIMRKQLENEQVHDHFNQIHLK